MLFLLGAALSACDGAAPDDADAVRPDSMARLERDPMDLARAAASMDTASGTYCDDRTAPADAERDAARARDERSALTSAGGRVVRDGGTLAIALANGRSLAVVDCNAPSESWLQHEYAGLDAAGRGHVISVSYYEGGAVQWVHATTGQVLSLASAPVFAADSQHFAIANADLEAGYTDNVFAIYRVTEAGAEEVFRESGGDEYGAAEPRWLDAGTVQFTRVHRASTPGQVLHLPVTATRARDTWRVNPEPPPPLLP